MRGRDCASTLAGWSESRVIRAMRAWRRGCAMLAPWFRATPFAAAHHYRDRTLPVRAPARPPRAVERLARSLPPANPSSLWIIDLPGPAGLWLAYLLRRRLRVAVALGFDGWYDPEGRLDGRAEIPLLLTLGERLRGTRPRAEAGVVLDRGRLGGEVSSLRLDNRYSLGPEDFPPLEHLRLAGRLAVCVFTEGGVAPDLGAWLDDVRPAVAVEIVTGLEARAA
jgi:hypothetical protein